MQLPDDGPADQMAVSALIEDLVRGSITAEEMGAALTYDDSQRIRPSDLQAEWLEWVIDEFDPKAAYFRDTINQALSGLAPGDDLDERLAVTRVLAAVSEDLHSVEKTVCAARGQEAPSRPVLIEGGFFDHVEQNLTLPADERLPYRASIPLRRITSDADAAEATALNTDDLSAVLSRHLDDTAIKDAASRCATPGDDADAVAGEPAPGAGAHQAAEARDLQAQAKGPTTDDRSSITHGPHRGPPCPHASLLACRHASMPANWHDGMRSELRRAACCDRQEIPAGGRAPVREGEGGPSAHRGTRSPTECARRRRRTHALQTNRRRRPGTDQQGCPRRHPPDVRPPGCWPGRASGQ